MKKRIAIGLLILLSAFTGIFLIGAAKRDFELTLTDGDSVILQKNYNIKPRTRLKVIFLYKNSYKDYFYDMGGDEGVYDDLNATLKEDIANAVSSVEYPPTDASVDWDGNTFTYSAEAYGARVDRLALAKALFENMNRAVNIKVQKHTIAPSITEKMLREATVETAAFSTNYSGSSDSRKHNIKLAVSLINGSIIKDGERFSFNTAVGARTLARGFLEAKIISNGKFVKGVGGGVCQVSTTLYNAALRAGLDVVTVSNHSLPVAYVPLSFDAMVSSSSDLVLENTTGSPVFIKGESDGSSLEFTFFGRNLYKDSTLKCRTEIIKIIYAEEYEDIHDSSQLGENEPYKVLSQPKCGYVSEGFIDIYKNDDRVSCKKIRHDVYGPQKGVRIVPDKPGENPLPEAS